MDVKYYGEGVSLLIIGTFGIIGNVLAIVMFSRQLLQKSFYGLMLSLAAFDLLYITTSILCYGIPQLSDEYNASAINKYNLPWIRSLTYIAMTGSIYFTMAITIERYVTVCRPLYRVSHSWPNKRLVFFLVAIAILYNIPRFLELECIECNECSEDGNITSSFQVIPTKLRANNYYYRIYEICLPLLLMSFGPFVLLVVLNALIVRELVRSSNHLPVIAVSGPGLEHALHQRRREIVLAKVSLAIVFVFILCHSLKWIPNVYELIYPPNMNEWGNWVKIITHFSHLALVFNSSVNFYIYLGKHWQTRQTIFNIPKSSASNQTEMTRLHTRSLLND